jgi:predicted SnoaL-like aldol condensation-catalyzing enzyme
MDLRGVSIAATAALLLGVSVSHAGTGAQEEKNKRVASIFVHAMLAGDYDKIAPYIGPGFKTHDWHVKGGDQPALKTAFEGMAKQASDRKVAKERSFADGDYVTSHFVVDISGAKPMQVATVEIFKFSKGKIVEQWNVAQPVPAQSANSNGIF